GRHRVARLHDREALPTGRLHRPLGAVARGIGTEAEPDVEDGRRAVVVVARDYLVLVELPQLRGPGDGDVVRGADELNLRDVVEAVVGTDVAQPAVPAAVR